MILTKRLTIQRPLANPIIAYFLITYIFCLGDALMSYTIPVYIDKNVSSTFIMGIIFSFSSFVGLIFDFLIPRLFRTKKYLFFLIGGFVSAFTFPLLLMIFPPIAFVLLMSMAVWGIYYEMETFSNFQFIKTFTTKDQHALSWGMLSSFRSAAYFIGPLIAALLIEKSDKLPFYTTLGLFLFGFFILLFVLKSLKKKGKPVLETEVQHRSTTKRELKVWFVLLKRLWPLYLFALVLNFVDAFFWTVGPLLSESLKVDGIFGGILLTVYMLPSLFMGFFAGKLAKPFGKKRISLVSGIFSGVLFVLSGFIPNIWLFILLIFFASLVISVAYPEISAVFEDYVSRLSQAENDIVGLQSSAASVSYILGPILAGFIATAVGDKLAFSVMGAILLVVSLISFILIPRKIKMPQAEISKVLQ